MKSNRTTKQTLQSTNKRNNHKQSQGNLTRSFIPHQTGDQISIQKETKPQSTIKPAAFTRSRTQQRMRQHALINVEDILKNWWNKNIYTYTTINNLTNKIHVAHKQKKRTT